MKYTTANKVEADAAREYLERLITDKRTVEIKRVSKRRSLKQNNYLYLLLGEFASELGYTVNEAKTLYKMENLDIYSYTKNDKVFLRSSADLTTDEMTKTVDRFRTYAGELGIDLPLPTDEAWLQSLENKIEQNRRYL